MRRWKPAPAAVFVTAGLLVWGLGCSRSGPGIADDELGALVLEPEMARPIDVDRLGSDVDELVRATQLPHSRVAAALGAHRYQSKLVSTIFEGTAAGTDAEPDVEPDVEPDAGPGVGPDVGPGAEPIESLEVETLIELSANGAFHARNQNSKDYGYEVFFVDDQLYLAPRYSRFHRRAPERDAEPEAIRSEMYGELGAHMELLARGIALEDRGTGQTNDQIADRTVRTVGITVAPSPRAPTQRQTLAHRQWRDTITVTEASGELVIDTQSGVVLRANLHGAVSFKRGDARFVMRFDVTHGVADIGADIEISAPPDDRWVATPLRSHEVDERNALLEGIAPAFRGAVAKPGTETPGHGDGNDKGNKTKTPSSAGPGGDTSDTSDTSDPIDTTDTTDTSASSAPTDTSTPSARAGGGQ